MAAWRAGHRLSVQRLLLACMLYLLALPAASSHPIDDYCDDQRLNDEPYSNACPSLNATYRCHNVGFLPLNVSTSVLRDGVCDCCDGSDEWRIQKMAERDGMNLQHVEQYGRAGVECPNTCKAKAARYLQQFQAAIDTYQRGLHARQTQYDTNATKTFVTLRQRIQRYQQVIEKHDTLVKNLQQAGRDAKPTEQQMERYMKWRDAQQQLQFLKHLIEYRDNPNVLAEGNSMLALYGKTYEYVWSARLYDDHGAVNERYLVQWSPLFNVTLQYLSSHDDHGNERTDHERASSKVQTVAGHWLGYLNLTQSASQRPHQPNFAAAPAVGLTEPYKRGERCWDAGEREVSVHISCGDATSIISFDEQGKCSYQMQVVSPVACLTNELTYMTERLKQYKHIMSGSVSSRHEEL